MKIDNLLKSIFKSEGNSVFNNTIWGIISNVIQNILLSIFFIIIARQYSKIDFANYIIANTLYSFLLGFSTLGLGYWFVREVINTNDKKQLLDKFFKMQLYVGILFYILSVIISYLLYESELIRSLSIIIGINIIFDNIIYVIKYLNIAELQQKKSFILLIFEAILKCGVACIILFYPINIILLSFILICLRLITLNLFISFGSSNSISLKKIIKARVSFKEIRNIIGQNWSFVVIGSLSIVNWRIGNIFVSKFLDFSDVANYEVSFKLLSLAYILPVIVSSTIYPLLLSAYKVSVDKMKDLYFKVFLPFFLFGILSFTFVYSFADNLIPFIFGAKFIETSKYCKEMFLVMLVFPTLLLQANVLITIKLEKLDMLCNVISLAINVSLCLIGLSIFKTLSVVNYSIFLSFLGFHIIQDVVLIKNKIANINHVFLFYATSIILVFFYYYLSTIIDKEYLFFVFWLIIAFIFYMYYKNKIRKII